MDRTHRTTPNGWIDYDFYRKDAARRRTRARRRVMRLIARRIASAVCAPWCALATSWQATWPSPAAAQAELPVAEHTEPTADRPRAA